MSWAHPQRGPATARPSSRCRTPVARFEALEDRRLLAASLLEVNLGAATAFPTSLINVNDTLFFIADDGVHGRELWRSDGTPTGTRMVKDIRPGAVGGFFDFPAPKIHQVNGTMFFAADDGAHGLELWRSDGTAAGTVIVKDIVPGLGDAFERNIPDAMINVNGTLFLTAIHPTLGRELFKSDGTAAGTVLVKDISQGPGYGSPSDFTNVNGTLFFTAIDRDAGGVSHGRELWKSNGTAAGTVLVADIYPGDDGIFDPRPENLMNFGGALYFTADPGPEAGEELWRSDGTAAGTSMVIDLNTGLYHSSQPSAMTEFNGKLYFWATGTTSGLGLWKTNGTAAGTQLVTTNPVAGGSITVVGNKMYFAAINAAGGFDLCKSDGTTAGTTRITQIITRAEFDERRYTLNIGMTNVRGTLYMAASNGTSGVELFKSDGTAAGTRIVADINAGTGSSDPASITEVNGRIFFTANNPQHGNELWSIPIGGSGQDDDDDLRLAKRRALPTELA